MTEYGVTARYAPGPITPEQVEEYRQKFEAARQKEREAREWYEAAYRLYCDALYERKEAEAVYLLAQRGMVQVMP
jgi:hypothetical protein